MAYSIDDSIDTNTIYLLAEDYQMPEGKGYGSQMGGSTKSSARNAPMDKSTGNYGKAIGDKGRKNSKGNSKTYCPTDRY